LASGDVISIIHDAGDGNTFSYTSAIDLYVTNLGGVNFGEIAINNWVSATTGVYAFVRTAEAPTNMYSRPILKSGQTIGWTDADINTYGLMFTGIEI
jgi:hypothetical protein